MTLIMFSFLFVDIAVLETLLSVVGYDAVWRPREQEYPHNTPPWLSGVTGSQQEIKKIIAEYPKGYTELIFGFADVDRCIDNLLAN